MPRKHINALMTSAVFAILDLLGDLGLQALEVLQQHHQQLQVGLQGELGGPLLEALPLQPLQVLQGPVRLLRVVEPPAQHQRVDPLLGVGQFLGGLLPGPGQIAQGLLVLGGDPHGGDLPQGQHPGQDQRIALVVLDVVTGGPHQL